MVLIDPIFMASDGSLNLEGPTVEARAFMRKMLAFAAEEKILFLWTRNLTKNRSNGALNAGRGSAELGNAARAVLHLGEFADTPGIYGLAVAACNDGKKVPTLVYSVETVDRHGRIAHRGERDVTADDLLAGADALLDRTLLDRAKRIIRQMIPSGWVDSKIIKQKGEAAMASTRTMQQAHLALKCTEKQEGSRESTVVYWGLQSEGGNDDTPHAPAQLRNRTLERFPRLSYMGNAAKDLLRSCAGAWGVGDSDRGAQPARGTAAAPDLAADLAAIPAPWHPLPHEPLAGQADRRGPRAGRMPGRGRGRPDAWT